MFDSVVRQNRSPWTDLLWLLALALLLIATGIGLRGKPITKRPDLFWTYGAYGEYGASPRPTLPVDNSPAFAIRSGPWKLLADGNGGDAELYNVVADPREGRNLVTTCPAIARRLTARLIAWQQSMPLRPSLAKSAQSGAGELSSSTAREDSAFIGPKRSQSSSCK